MRRNRTSGPKKSGSEKESLAYPHMILNMLKWRKEVDADDDDDDD